MVPPAALGRHIGNQPWPRDLLQALLERIYLVLRASPSAAQPLLQLAGAISAAAAGSVQVSTTSLLHPTPLHGSQPWSSSMSLLAIGLC